MNVRHNPGAAGQVRPGSVVEAYPIYPSRIGDRQLKELLRAAEGASVHGLTEDYEAEWASRAEGLLSRLSSAAFKLEMRVDSNKAIQQAIAQQESLEELKAARDDGELSHDAITVHTLGHLEFLMKRLEALADRAERCETKLFCKCRMPLRSEGCDFGVEEVMARGGSIRQYLIHTMNRFYPSDHPTASVNPVGQDSMATGHEAMSMVFAWRGLGAVFRSCMPTPPRTVKEFLENWDKMWKSECLQDALRHDLIARKEEARQREKEKKPHDGKKLWQNIFRRSGSGGSESTRPSIRSIRSWA